jgi:hypothetical protein
MAMGFVSPDTIGIGLAILFVCFFAFVLFGVFMINIEAQKHTSRLIDRWCTENNFKLVSKKLDRLSSIRGPFAFDLRTNRPVYAVTVKDQTGELRKATIARAMTWYGASSDRIVVVWDRANTTNESS